MDRYPAPIPHPSGFKTMTVYSAAEEEAVLKANAKWRADHQAANLAAREGTDLTPAKAPASTTLTLKPGA